MRLQWHVWLIQWKLFCCKGPDTCPWAYYIVPFLTGFIDDTPNLAYESIAGCNSRAHNLNTYLAFSSRLSRALLILTPHQGMRRTRLTFPLPPVLTSFSSLKSALPCASAVLPTDTSVCSGAQESWRPAPCHWIPKGSLSSCKLCL